MTTATESTIKVPVRTWQEKAILATAISAGLSSLWEGFDGHIGANFDFLVEPTATDGLIDDYFDRRPPEVVAVEELLRTLRETTCGPDAVLEVPARFDLLKRLDDEISDMAREDVETILVPHPSRREMAQALIAAIDLRDEIAAGDA